MYCPHCSEKLTILELIKHNFWVYLPDSIYRWIEKRKEDKELALLIKHYESNADLTEREHFVCSSRVNGQEMAEISKHLNVTKERIRSIQSKALRKILRNKI